MTESILPRLIPTGTCWCGCGHQVGVDSFFAPGHDKVAEGALLAARYGGSVHQILHAHGYGPGDSVTDAAIASGAWSRCDQCSYSGSPTSLRIHRQKDGH